MPQNLHTRGGGAIPLACSPHRLPRQRDDRISPATSLSPCPRQTCTCWSLSCTTGMTRAA